MEKDTEEILKEIFGRRIINCITNFEAKNKGRGGKNYALQHISFNWDMMKNRLGYPDDMFLKVQLPYLSLLKIEISQITVMPS